MTDLCIVTTNFSVVTGIVSNVIVHDFIMPLVYWGDSVKARFWKIIDIVFNFTIKQ